VSPDALQTTNARSGCRRFRDDGDPLDHRVVEGVQLGDRFKEVRVQRLSSVAPIEASIDPAMPVTFLEGVWRRKLVAIGPPADAIAARRSRVTLQVARSACQCAYLSRERARLAVPFP
jgi:hypothetical protein